MMYTGLYMTKMSWAEHVAEMSKKKSTRKNFIRGPKGKKEHKTDLDINGIIG